MSRVSWIASWMCVVTLTAAITALTTAGPLDPPAGPVAGTHKTLSDVEPRVAVNSTNTPGDADSLYKITEPGSYYLTGNINGVAGKHGIEIATSGVSIDLCGFDLVGAPGMGAFDGITATGVQLRSIAIFGGSVRDWGDKGIELGGPSVDNGRIERVNVSGNAGIGLVVGNTFTVIWCTARSNAGVGISTGTGCVVTGCSASDNGGTGIAVGSGCNLSHSSAISNAVHGFTATDGSAIVECTATFNTANGIRVVGDCTVRGNTCDSNGFSTGDGAGIFVIGGNNRIEANNCTDNDRGIDVNVSGNFISRNTCAGNTNNWDVVAGNVIFVVSASTSGAFTGISGGVPPGSTDPNANFSY
ncbi:MAG: hypothetical protein GIKADHBN_00129 [Phycisphaerales bacterium]|nr:hypothetical protein [Phycisphaerales bacterium]